MDWRSIWYCRSISTRQIFYRSLSGESVSAHRSTEGLQLVNNLVYLGLLMCVSGSPEKEVQWRIALGRVTFNRSTKSGGIQQFPTTYRSTLWKLLLSLIFYLAVIHGMSRYKKNSIWWKLLHVYQAEKCTNNSIQKNLKSLNTSLLKFMSESYGFSIIWWERMEMVWRTSLFKRK